jgi:serine protease Do
MRLGRRVGTAGCALLAAVLAVAVPAAANAAQVAGVAQATEPDAPAAQAQDAPSSTERAAAIATPAIVNLEVRWDGYLYDLRSGTLVDPAPVTISAWCTGVGVGGEGFLATTAPCVDAATVLPELVGRVLAAKVRTGQLTRAQADADLTGLLDNAVLVGDPDGAESRRTIQVRRAVNGEGPLPASVVEQVVPSPVALLKIDKENQPMLAVADDEPGIGDPVVIMNCDVGYAQPVRPSHQESVITETEPELLVAMPAPAATPTPSANATAWPATAVPGGVVLTKDGTLLGLVDGVTDGQARLVPGREIAQALAAADVEAEPGTIDKAFRDGLDALYAGEYTQAVESFDAVLAIIPTHASAHAYRDQAQALRSAQGGPEPELGFFGTIRSWISGHSGLLVGLTVLAAILAFLIRRQHPHDHGPDRDHEQGQDHGEGARP